MPSNHLILCHPLIFPSIFPSIRVFSNESALHIRWASHQLQHQWTPRTDLLWGWTGWISLQSKGLLVFWILVFWMLSFKPTFSLSFFTLIKRLFSSSSLSAIRVMSSAYLRLLIFLLAILIPACASSSPAFLVRFPACKLNKQGDNIQPRCTPFPIWN